MASRLDPQPTVVRVLAAATANLTLSGPQTVDAVPCVAGDLVWAQAQSTANDRAIYLVQDTAWILVDPGFSAGLQILVRSGNDNAGKVYRILNSITWGAGAPSIVTDGSSSGPSSTFTSGLILQGPTPAGAADSVVYGVADLLGAGTAAEQKIYEGAAVMTHRLRGAGVLLKVEISESVADDAVISLPAPNAGRLGVLEVRSDAQYGEVLVASDATITATSYVSTDFSTTDTDNKLCVFDAGSTISLRNRLGSTKWLIGSYRWA